MEDPVQWALKSRIAWNHEFVILSCYLLPGYFYLLYDQIFRILSFFMTQSIPKDLIKSLKTTLKKLFEP